jgi:polyisoprenoid-binding protein YceI
MTGNRAAPRALCTSVIAAAMAAWMLVAAGPCAAAGYAIDKKHTEVRFAYTMGLSTQRGRFTSVEGNVEFDAATPEKTTVAASIATASLTTGEPLVDQTLKGSDFFNVEEAPQMVFTSRSVRSKSAEAAEMIGDMTINGITKPVTLAVMVAPHNNPALKYSQDSLEFLATTRIRRSAFNMTAYASMAGDDIDIEIDAILRKSR